MAHRHGLPTPCASELAPRPPPRPRAVPPPALAHTVLLTDSTSGNPPEATFPWSHHSSPASHRSHAPQPGTRAYPGPAPSPSWCPALRLSDPPCVGENLRLIVPAAPLCCEGCGRLPGCAPSSGQRTRPAPRPDRLLKFPGRSRPRRGPFTGSMAVLGAPTRASCLPALLTILGVFV